MNNHGTSFIKEDPWRVLRIMGEFVESFDHLGAGQGGYNEDQEFFGYRMPI